MDEELKAMFEVRLTEAKEDYPTHTLQQQLQLATQWLKTAMEERIDRLVEQRWAGHLEATNKAHYG
jgi:hypothetical protein